MPFKKKETPPVTEKPPEKTVAPPVVTPPPEKQEDEPPVVEVKPPESVHDLPEEPVYASTDSWTKDQIITAFEWMISVFRTSKVEGAKFAADDLQRALLHLQ